MLAAPGFANASMLNNAKQRMLSFSHTHTGETMSVVYKVGDKFVSNSMANISRLMRDFRSGDVHPIDPALLDVLWQVQRNLKNTHAFEIISAYRSPKSNNMLRSRSAKASSVTTARVASTSAARTASGCRASPKTPTKPSKT